MEKQDPTSTPDRLMGLRDGENGPEGFNLFPDLVSRVLGIFIWDMLSRL